MITASATHGNHPSSPALATDNAAAFHAVGLYAKTRTPVAPPITVASTGLMTPTAASRTTNAANRHRVGSRKNSAIMPVAATAPNADHRFGDISEPYRRVSQDEPNSKAATGSAAP